MAVTPPLTSIAFNKPVISLSAPQSRVLVLSWLAASLLAILLTNQPDPTLHGLGQVSHVVSILAAATLLVLRFGTAGATFIVAVLGVHLVGVLTGERTLYLAGLCALFFLVGQIAARRHYATMLVAVTTITFASAVLMLLQIMGLAEWTQALATHGIVSETESVSKAPVHTFLVDLPLQITFLQGRPAGLFHSNQFASLFVLFTFALRISRPRDRFEVVDALLSVAAVLTLSKAVLLGILLILVALALRGDWRRARSYGTAVVLAGAGYAATFPGVFKTFFFNSDTFIISAAARVLDIAAALGFDISDALRHFKIVGALTPAIEGAMHVNGESLSALAALIEYLPLIYAALLAAVVIIISRPDVRGMVRSTLSNYIIKAPELYVLLALLAFSLSANMLAAPIFWGMFAFAIQPLRPSELPARPVSQSPS